MARLRSFGSMSFTTRSPMRNSPSLMSSSPTIMFNSVDFPQPEGPTRMKNSPSAMVKSAALTASVPSAKRLVTWSTTISAMGGLLAFHCAGGEAGDDPALEHQHHDDDGDGDDHRRGGDR